ncbi:MAG: Rho termination factor N-terminal domain-containing protein [Actinobacteria bacterium]|nr:Rho termination factor N-terminal domain-containing protein [Actinomycetota bacterium]
MSGNDTANTPELSETELREMRLDDLRERAKEEGVGGTSSMRKEDLVKAISDRHRRGESGRDAGSESAQDPGRGREPERDRAGDGSGGPGDAGPDQGRVRGGPDSSKSLKYSQEVTSPEDEPERAGRSLATTSHEVIRQWAEERDGVPATVPGTEHDDHLGVLRIDFGGQDEALRHVSWEEWFATFDDRSLNFLYQEERKDGRQSTFFRLENPGREDA